MRTPLHAGVVTLLLLLCCGVTERAVARNVEPGAHLLASPFTHHAVLQRDRVVPVWGNARPGATVQVTLAGSTASTHADHQGRWRAHLPALPAGGPYTLTARSDGHEQRVADVLLGDVWLCSGQSNMELQVHRSLDARAEIASADNDRIRLLQVVKASSTVPLQAFEQPPEWLPVTPDSVRDFSAACYFFARELQRHVGVPMGLIHASWGGSRIEAWVSADGLRQLPGQGAALDNLALHARDPQAAIEHWGERWQHWWQHAPGVAPGDAPWLGASSDDWIQATPSARWLAPALAAHVGQAWYRTTLELDAEAAAQAATLELGPVDETDISWVNGHAVGSASGADMPRRYSIPAGVLRAGKNVIVVHALNTYREGGIGCGPDAQAVLLADGRRLPLDGQWSYRIVAPTMSQPPSAPWMATSGLATLYNGMLAPLAGYGLRGTLWYQGESNTGDARAYHALLTAWRADQRAHFGENLPVLIVQLANYGAPPTTPAASQWAELRDAQRQAVADDPRSGLAISIDLGERGDIHPANKQDVGRRLARAARHVVYAEHVTPSGPVARRAFRDGNEVVIAFDDVVDDLVALGAPGPIGVELCGDDQSSCHYAPSRISGKTLRLAVDGSTSPTRVRHAWADSPVVTLYDGAGMPAGPFELPIQ